MSIQFNKVSYTYAPNTPFEYHALNQVSLEIKKGSITAIIGATGSGKSTLVQHLNALLLPSEGEVSIFDKKIIAQQKPSNLKELRSKVGLVFQFPEYQLFEETVLKDIMFGPLNFGVDAQEAQLRALHTLKVVGLDESVAQKSPLDLSGGQKRRVAIAGILAIDPDILVLDEPTAGLDPQGSKAMMQLFLELNQKYQKTVLIVTHDMEHVLHYCDRVVVMNKGQIVTHTTVVDFFKDFDLMKSLAIHPPKIIQLKQLLKSKGFIIDDEIMDVDALAKAIMQQEQPHE